MRILRLRFRNLNSLAGDWDIDFTHPAYVSSGIFAITGPTGAGKTTILDGICLALYGRTPRLKGITQSENEIMSRQTGDCSAEVEFETGKGRFRCHWSQHRSRRQADGQLQAPKHEIAEAISGTILESKLKAVAAKVEEVTGMDFERFTRSMLLAQGGFDAFLQAAPDKRAPILEQITGTEIYSRISMKVHELTTEERRKLEAIRLELDGMQFLSPEEEESLRREQAEKQLEEKALSASVLGIRDAQTWRERLELLEGEIAQLEEARLSLEAEKLAAAAELESLAQARRTLALDGDYAQICALRKQQNDEQTELANAGEKLPKTQLGLQAAVDVLGQAESSLKKAQDEQQREAELIRKTRELDVKLAEANSRVDGLQKDWTTIRLQCDGYLSSIAASEGEIEAAGALLQDNEAHLGEQSADAGLVEALTGMEQQIRTLKSLNRQCTERRNMLEQQATASKSAELLLQQANSDWEKASQLVTEAENQLGVIQVARNTLLQGRELSFWREETERLTTRLRQLENLKDAVTRIEGYGQKLAALQTKLDALEQKRQVGVGQEEKLTRECGLREDVARQLQDKLVLLNRVRDLEEERTHLVDGVPCPLCGAVEHPYAAGNVPRLDDAQQELEKARTVFKAVSERVAGVRLEIVGVTKEIEQAKLEQQECRERTELDETLCAAGFVELSLTAAAVMRDEVIRVELESCRSVFGNCRGVIGEVEVKDQELLRANTLLATARDALTRSDKARHAAELGSQAATGDGERLKLEVAALQGDLDRALAEAERAFEPYGCKEINPNNADALFNSLTVRRNDYVKRLREKERLEKVLADLNGKKRQEQALLDAAEKNLSGLRERLAGSSAQRDNLTDQRRELFGERNPDSEEKRLTAALTQAGMRRDVAFQEQNRLQNELDGLKQQQQKLTGAITTRSAQLFKLEAALQLRMTAAGFADEAAYLLARLPQARFDELSCRADLLQRNEVQIAARRQDRAAALQQELDRKLTEKTLAQLREESIAATTQLSELQKVLVSIELKLQQHAEQQTLQQARLQAGERQKKACARWERLHELIGSSDGKKFRNFAQGLTFELMVAHANRQLQKMSDRYILERDSDEPLELNVIDNYQAGEIRSTKNLSGGESFIVSLALALGLSSMASHNVRVDSLFLDEGFGTLDEDALETALETLSGLQQDGKLIGIISHVPALKERIGTQIQVEAGNAGRSSLSGPGCSRQ